MRKCQRYIFHLKAILSSLNKTVSMKDKRFKTPQENKYPFQKSFANTTEKGMHFMQYGHTNPTLPPPSYLHVNWTVDKPISMMHLLICLLEKHHFLVNAYDSQFVPCKDPLSCDNLLRYFLEIKRSFILSDVSCLYRLKIIGQEGLGFL